jgi:hypothetical protein
MKSEKFAVLFLFAWTCLLADSIPDYAKYTAPTSQRTYVNLCDELFPGKDASKLSAGTALSATLLVGWETQQDIPDLDSGGGPLKGVGGFYDILYGRLSKSDSTCRIKPYPHGIRFGFTNTGRVINNEESIDAFISYLYKPNAIRFWAGPGISVQGHKTSAWGIGPMITSGISLYEWFGASVFSNYFLAGRTPYLNSLSFRADLFISAKFKEEHFDGLKWQ